MGTLEDVSVWKNCTAEKEMNLFIYKFPEFNFLNIYCTNLGIGDM